MKLSRLTICALSLMIAYYGGCTMSAPEGPQAGLGGGTVKKYVAVGNSLTAGYQSNALYASAQIYSMANLIAQQINLSGATLGSFEQPLYGDPGNPDPATGKAARYELISWSGPVIGPRGLAPGVPTNTALTRPYDNLGIPGSVVFDFLDSSSFTSASRRGNPFFLMVLRNPAFGKSILQQTVKLNPDLVTFWYGNNDVLGFATSGGFSPSAPTPSGIFTTLYNASLSSLRAALPSAKIVVGNIPDVDAIPFFTTLGPKIAGSIASLIAAGRLPAGAVLYYQKHGETGVATGTSALTEAKPLLICLTGSAYAQVLGQPTGKWYRDKGYPALPTGIDTTKPFGFHPQNPWPDALVLDLGEQTTAEDAITSFNASIASVAQANNAVVVDVNAFFHTVKTSGYRMAGETFTADYISGGLFSFDGVHPSSKGMGVMTNQWLTAMNRAYGWSIPLVSVASLPALPVPLNKSHEALVPVIPPDAFGSLEMLWGGGR